jgi:hypothetical protein
MMRPTGTAAILGGLGLLLGLGHPACSKDKDSSKSEPFPAAVLAKLGKKGLKVGEFKTADAKRYKAKECVEGEIEGLDILLCRFEDEKAAKNAEARLLRFTGKALSGAVRYKDSTAMVVADNKKTDIKGKTINRLLTTFSKL